MIYSVIAPLGQILVKNLSYPFPKITTIISQLSKFKFFSVLDLPSVYWQIDPISICTSMTPWDQFSCKRIPFGLKMASSKFQAMIDSVHHDTHVFMYTSMTLS